MKNTLLTVVLAGSIMMLWFTACTEEKKADESYNDYKEYVEERHANAEKYYDRKWDELEEEYKQRELKAEEKMEHWDNKMRAEYEATKLNWENFKESYRVEASRRENEQKTAMLMSTLLPEGIKEDMTNVDNSNVESVYKHFVNSVEAQKDNMTREQWDKTELLWERLDTRKNELEKEMKAGVKMQIAEQKIKYGAIKAVNRPVAKTEENMDAKDKDK